MKLITEQRFSEVETLVEAKDGKKEYYIEGVFMQGDLKNRNGRVYPMGILEREVNKINESQIKHNAGYGELGHPDGPTINLDRVSHLTKSLTKEGNNFVGKAKIISTPMGEIAKTFIDEGSRLGVSSRGMGTLRERNGANEVQEDFTLATPADIVSDPSAPDAFVKGIMEGVEFYYDDERKAWLSEQVKESVSKLHKRSLKEQRAVKLALFQRYLNSL